MNITETILEHPGWVLGSFFTTFLLTILLFLIVAGLFTHIEIKTQESTLGPLVMAYKTNVGPYKKVGALFTEAWSLLPGKEQIGLYYDDPSEVPEKELRCAVGPILCKGKEKPVKEEMDLMVKHGYNIFYLPDPGFVVQTSFPYRTTISILIAIWRVYPKLKKYITVKNLCAYPAIEVYQSEDILFMMPLSHQEEFFVGEFQEEQESVATTDMGSVMTNDKDDDRTTDDDLFLKPRTPVRVSRTSRRMSLEESSLSEAVNNRFANDVTTHGDDGMILPSVMSANGEYKCPDVGPVQDVYSADPSDEEEEMDDGSGASTNETSSFDDLTDAAEIKQRHS
eukprot:TRINITY_DN22828_c0_g1_i1.p1 TRINITY_DN22828_c0_g1~~TRINITY_DN22828_c0_g1_i1.p1  ORF type:complete len:338 (+),score=75.53 TRINITY_DN22828_c0_g1_i1:37-1050(+)